MDNWLPHRDLLERKMAAIINASVAFRESGG
jgi:hypothetical protein